VYNLVQRYLHSHQVESLHDLPHTGRPPDAPELTATQILRELRRSPLRLGYRTTVWTVETLAVHLSQRYPTAIAPWTLRRRMKHLGLVGKRPRYFYSEKHPHRAQKKGPLCGN
jgi:transposase